MMIFSELKRVVDALKSYPGSWALCGGVVASIYRKTPRFTVDIDIAIVGFEGCAPEMLASSVLTSLGYKPIKGLVPEFSKGETQHALICGRLDKSEMFAGIDFLLPVFPWVTDSVLRAQSNLIDYGFARLPTITLEDLLIAKIMAIQSSSRTQDVEDVESLLAEGMEIDKVYFYSQSSKLGVGIPDWIKDKIV